MGVVRVTGQMLCDPAFPNAQWVDDGKPCKIVRLADLQPGDTLLGWYGEPYDMGTVAKVEKFPVQGYQQNVDYRWQITYADGTKGNPLVNPDSPRRVLVRELIETWRA